jgi:DNA adenine methylase
MEQCGGASDGDVAVDAGASSVVAGPFTEPFLKWAGGKRSLLPQLLPLLPRLSPNGTYYEPFLGGGALFFALGPERSVLSDTNPELIETFVAVRDDPIRVLRVLTQLHYSKEDYYRIRSKVPLNPWQKAARFIYLNKTCFNGLFRVNFSGRFNVPFGSHGEGLVVCDRPQILAASRALRGATLRARDFEQAVASAVRGDLVYFDPPYTRAHRNNGFVEYNALVFKWPDQKRLAELGAQLVDRGVNIAISNANHRSIRALYKDERFVIHRIGKWSTIAGNPANRFPTSEVLITGKEV